jgi:hypothetical protein
MSELLKYYLGLIIKQYSDKTTPTAEMSLKVNELLEIKETVDHIGRDVELGQATGHRLDLIGKLVGLSRVVKAVIPKSFFGFKSNINSKGFSSKKDPSYVGGPLATKGALLYADDELNDPDYTTFLRAKIIKNNVDGYNVSQPDGFGLQDAISFLLGSDAILIDNFNMSLTLLLPYSIDTAKLKVISSLELLPKPQGVQLKKVIRVANKTFGFNINPNAMSFGSKTNTLYASGTFASKLIL